MRIFWHNGALQILPESQPEIKLLCELTGGLTLGKPPEMQNCISGGDTQSGDGLFEALVGHKESRPSRFTGKAHHKKQVICINKLP